MCVCVCVCVVTTCHLQQVSEEVFRQVFIPRTLDEVDTFERDPLLVARGQGEDIAYQIVTGMREDLSGPGSTPKLLESKLKNIQTKAPTIITHSSSAVSPLVAEVDENACEKEVDDGHSGSEGQQEADDVESSDDGSSDSDSSGGSEEGRKGEGVDRKAHKKAVKEANRERRKTKLPKHIKKRKEKLGRQKRGTKGK